MAELALLIGCLLWAVYRAAPASLHYYFSVRLIAAIAALLAMMLFGESSSTYAVAWCASCVLVWSFIIFLVYDSLRFVPKRFPAILCALACAAFVLYLSTHGRRTGLLEWMSLTDGSVLTICGLLTGIGAGAFAHFGQVREMWIALTLMVSWLAEALFDFGFSINMYQWMDLNQWVPVSIVAISCLTLSRLSKRIDP